MGHLWKMSESETTLMDFGNSKQENDQLIAYFSRLQKAQITD